EHAEENGRGDVVGQVAHDPVPPALRPAAEPRSVGRVLRLEAAKHGENVGLEHVAGHDGDVARHLFGKLGDQVAVDLDGEDGSARGGQRQRQRAASRPDLEKHVSRLWIDGLHDAPRPGGGEKVLSETATRPGRGAMNRRWRRPRRRLRAHDSPSSVSTAMYRSSPGGSTTSYRPSGPAGRSIAATGVPVRAA